MARKGNMQAAVRRSKDFAAQYNEPTINDLDQFIALANTRLTPDDNVDYERQVHPYAHVWAGVRQSARRVVQGKDEDAKASHAFMIRYDPAFTVERGHIIVWDHDVYRVLSTQPKGRRNDYVELTASIERSLEDYNMTVVDDETLAPEPDQTGDGGIPLWS